MNTIDTYDPSFFESSFQFSRKAYEPEELDHLLQLYNLRKDYVMWTNFFHPLKRHKGSVDLLQTKASDEIGFTSMNGSALDDFAGDSIYTMNDKKRRRLFTTTMRSENDHDGAVIYDREGRIKKDADGKYNLHWVDVNLEKEIPVAKGGARAKLAVWVSYHGFLVVKISERSWDPEMYINGFVAPYEAVETYVRGMLVQQAENEIEGKSRHMSAKDRARVDMSLIKSKK